MLHEDRGLAQRGVCANYCATTRKSDTRFAVHHDSPTINCVRRSTNASAFFRSMTSDRLYRLLQNFDELGDCRGHLGLFFPNREQFELTARFS
jgi:hypothetical protein